MKASAFLLVLIALFLVSIPVAFALGITSTLLMGVTSAGIRFGVIIQRIIGGVNTLSPEFVIFSLDVFEYILEHECYQPASIEVVFSPDNAFSMKVRSGNSLSVHNHLERLIQQNKESYDINWWTIDGGYQFSARVGG